LPDFSFAGGKSEIFCFKADKKNVKSNTSKASYARNPTKRILNRPLRPVKYSFAVPLGGI